MLRSLSHQLAGPSGSSLSRLAAAASDAAPSVSCESFIPAAYTSLMPKRWATKKQGGSTRNTKDSHPKHLGAKMLGGQLIFPGQIIVTQRGTKFRPGVNVGMGRDFTLFSKIVGFIKYRRQRMALTGRAAEEQRFIDVLPAGGDWGPAQAERMAKMVAVRNDLKTRLLGPRAAAAR